MQFECALVELGPTRRIRQGQILAADMDCPDSMMIGRRDTAQHKV
jgi:hypothetical protein